MFWFKFKKDEETFIVKDIHFLGEQYGIPEQKLKVVCSKLFLTLLSVERAYFALITYGEPKIFGLAMCISAIINSEEEKQYLVNILESTCVQFFNKDVRVHVLFINNEQENELSKVCEPFYIKRYSLKDNEAA